jgi:hypothetical protein
MGDFSLRRDRKNGGSQSGRAEKRRPLLMTAAVLIIVSVNPIASALGAAMACATFLLTTSFVFSTPGIAQISPFGFPIISTSLQQFLLKDVVLLAVCLTLVVASLPPRGLRLHKVRNSCKHERVW